jgi:N-acetylmuramoyl-L-alanine amidase
VPKIHRVKAGECISSIALANGHFPETIWNDDANTKLRELRENGNVLAPGDEVSIPDKRLRTETGATGQLHKFKRKGVPEKLCIRLEAFDEPRANLEYRIDIDGRLESGLTDSDGLLYHYVPPDTRRVTLYVDSGNEEVYDLLVAGLDPVTHESGVRARLYSLHFLSEVDADEEEFSDAIRRFQAHTDGLDATGDLDDATRDKLVEVHGS